MSKEAEEASLGGIVKELVQNSSAHGLPNIYQGTHWMHRTLWTILFFCGVIAVGWQVTMIFLKYISAPYQVNVENRFKSDLEFPSITLCNVNPVLKTELEKSDDSFRSFFDTNFVPPPPQVVTESIPTAGESVAVGTTGSPGTTSPLPGGGTTSPLPGGRRGSGSNGGTTSPLPGGGTTSSVTGGRRGSGSNGTESTSVPYSTEVCCNTGV